MNSLDPQDTPRSGCKCMPAHFFANAGPAFADSRLLESMLVLASDWYWEQGPDLRFTFLVATEASGRYAAVVQTALGKTRRELARPLVSDKIMDAHEETLRARKPFRDFEFEASDGTGRWRWISVSGEPVFSVAGEFLGYRGVAREITSRKLSEEQARAAEVVLGQAGAAIYTHDRDAKILSWNRGAERLLGYAAEEVIGKNALDLLLHESWKAESFAILRRIRTAGERSFEGVYVTKSGKELPVEVWSFPQYDDCDERSGEVVIARDISDRKLTERALYEAEARYRSLVEMAPDAILVHDEGRIVYANKAAAILFAAPNPADLIGRDFFELIHEADRELVRRRAQAVLDGSQVPGYPVRRILALNGEVRVAEMAGGAIEQDGRRLLQVIGREVTERHRAEARLRESEERYRALFEVASDAIVVFDAGSTNSILDANANAEKLFGLPREQILENDPARLSPERQPCGASSVDLARLYIDKALAGETPTFEWVHLHASGKPVYCEIRLVRVPPFERPVVRGSILDISEKVIARQALREHEERLEYLAAHDSLTGLANRTLLHDRIRNSIERARRHKEEFAVVFIDLDRFKAINDNLGHVAGDQALQLVAKLIAANVRGTDTVARHGGDEFVVLVEEMGSREDAEPVVRRIMRGLSAGLSVEGNEMVLNASIGIAIYPKDGEDVETLIRRADIAMYQVKETGRNDYLFYDSSMSDHATQYLRLENELRRAIARDELLLHYQPKVHTDTGGIVGFEALMRWNKPELGMISPGTFIPIAEDSGLIVEMGYWALEQACRQMRVWQDAGLPPVPVAVNLSARQFLDRNLTRRIGRILDEVGLAPRWLELEVTESATMQDEARSQAVMQELVETGLHISMDDFGTGYSSLAYIMKFPIGTLKVDRSFIADIPQEPQAVAITSAVMAMGKSLNLAVVAEGVETAEQVAFLRSIGCEVGQGFFFSPAVPAAEAERLLRGRTLRADYFSADAGG